MSENKSSFRPSKLTEWEIEAAANLRRLFSTHTTLSQKAFGARYEIGSGSLMTQYLRGLRPIKLATAIKFAKGLGVSVAEISPVLAQQLPPAQISSNKIEELTEVVARLTTSGKMQMAEVDAMIAMLKARESDAK